MISVMMIKEDIEDIIWRDYQGICSEEEKLSLQEWIEASEKNRLVFEQIRSIIESGELVKGYDVLNEQNALEKVMRRIKPRSIHRYVWLRYAAGILLPLILVAIAYYFMAPNETMESPVIAHQIQPGMSKATLYLSDGQEIDLLQLGDSTLRDGLAEQEILLRGTSNTLNYYDPSRGIRQVEKVVYNKIVVPRGGEYMLILSDGTKVWLNSETEMEYPLCFGLDVREVRLKGEAYFEVKKDVKRKFNVVMDGATIEVTGTSFNESCYPDEYNCCAILETGRINLLANNTVNKVNIGERAVYDKKSGEVTINPVDLKYYTSWRHGTFHFYNTPLSEIVRALGRWYDVEFRFEDESLQDVCFSGAALRNRPIDFMLRLLENTQSVKFSIQKDGMIWISKK